MGVYGITLHGSGKVRIVIKPHFIDPQMSEGEQEWKSHE